MIRSSAQSIAAPPVAKRHVRSLTGAGRSHTVELMPAAEDAQSAAMGPVWHAVVLSWNGREDTLRCLESLSSVEHADLEIICVDNGSSDGSQQAVRERFPQVFLIEAGVNLGYSGGNNLGIRHALEHGARWVVLVNNDASVAPDVIEGFARAARERPRAGILAGKVYRADRPQTIWNVRGCHLADGSRNEPWFLQVIPGYFVYFAIFAWTITFIGLLSTMGRSLMTRATGQRERRRSNNE